ncbi:MAG: class I tRNA ligase family protein, partial [Candidatus Aminicenantales bacterium]
FVTEEIWQHLPSAGKSLAVASFPAPDSDLIDEKAEARMKVLQEAIVEVRTLKAEHTIPLREKVTLWVKGPEDHARVIQDSPAYFEALAHVRNLEVWREFPQGQKVLKGVAGSVEVAIPLKEGLVDFRKEKERLEREIAKVKAEIAKVEKRLNNADFLRRAPEEVIQQARERLEELVDRSKKLHANLDHVRDLM